MRKKIYILTVLTLFALTIAPVLAADTNGASSTIGTLLNKDAGGGADPIVKAKWEMKSGSQGLDDSTDPGAQFMASGVYQVGTPVTVCTVVTDPDGVADINGVYADVFYPLLFDLGPNHEPNRQGCGAMVGNEFSLSPLSKADGISLFCNSIRSNNNNLPNFNNGYNYDEICATDGELMKETARVYCGTMTLSYEDPSGDYRVEAIAQDKNGLTGGLQNYFRYLDTTAFDVDFSTVNYGNVKLNTHKIINGDLTFANGDGKPTVRNVGNTRLAMQVWQDDMGLGKTDSSWNVRYDGRVGSDAAFTVYDPFAVTMLNLPLNLSQTNEMDFSIDIFKWPPTHIGESYAGTMVLGASKVEHLACAP